MQFKKIIIIIYLNATTTQDSKETAKANQEGIRNNDVQSNSYNQYQPIGAFSSTTIDPKIEKTRNLFEMFHLAR
jgi:hypothetical protein